MALASMMKKKASRRTNLKSGMKHRIVGATEIELEGPFNAELDFVDLHLDFPVEFGDYVMGHTPFMKAAQRAGIEKTEFHRARLQMINDAYKDYPHVAKLIDMYLNGYHNPFAETALKRFGIYTK